LREQRKQMGLHDSETTVMTLRGAQINEAGAVEAFPVDEVLVTSATLYFP
jgi:hypothetical protein